MTTSRLINVLKATGVSHDTSVRIATYVTQYAAVVRDHTSHTRP